jgi:hypothetical protein
MALEALVGGKCLWLLLDSAFTSGSLPLMTMLTVNNCIKVRS